jgi:erythromycin esterase
MQNQIYTVLILILVIFSSCQKPKKKFSASQIDPSSKNFSFLKEAIKDVRILAIGESSHGFGSMHTLKSNLVQYLHKELGYKVLVIEAGYGDVGMSWHIVDQSTPEQLINTTVSANLRSEQMLPLFEYLKGQKETENPLEYRGMDTRVTGYAFRYRLMYVIKRLEPKLIQDSIENGLTYYGKAYEVRDDEEEWNKNMEHYRNTIKLALSIIQESKEDIIELEILEEKEIDILDRYLKMMLEAVNYKFGETLSRGLVIRDSLMAETVFNIANEEFPETKIIIWGHNGHIEKGPGEGDNIKWLGHYLKEKYGEQYYALGMYAKKGFIYQTSEKKTSTFDLTNPTFIEVKITKDYGKNVFLDLPLFDETNTSWVNKTIFGYELEAGGKVSFIPSKRFDGILLIEETEAPTYLINPDNPRRKE